MDGPFLLRPKLETKGCEFQGMYGRSAKKNRMAFPLKL